LANAAIACGVLRGDGLVQVERCASDKVVGITEALQERNDGSFDNPSARLELGCATAAPPSQPVVVFGGGPFFDVVTVTVSVETTVSAIGWVTVVRCVTVWVCTFVCVRTCVTGTVRV
jgi:hypothetical protein